MINKNIKDLNEDISYKLTSNISLEGASPKIILKNIETKQNYILKFPKEKAGTVIKDHITEYISCRIAKEMNFSVQEVELGLYNKKECVIIKMFDNIPETFDGFGTSTLEGEVFEYNLDNLLNLKINKHYGITKKDYLSWVWEVFALDMLLGNFDRHERNWGFIRDKSGKYIPSPLYDFGSSLSPRLIDENTDVYKDSQIIDLINNHHKSAIIVDGKKRTYMEILKNYKNYDDLKKSINKIITLYEKIDIAQILKNVSGYNTEYAEYTKFINRLLNMKISILKEVINYGK